MKLKLFFGLGSLVIVFGVVFVFAITAEPKNPNGPTPVPNAFNTVRRASELMTPVPLDFDTSQDLEALNRYLGSNAQTLALSEKAADQESLCPLDEFGSMEELIESANAVRGLSRVMFVKARVAELEGRSTDAADVLAEMMMVGRRSSRGGLLIQYQVAAAIELQATEALLQILPKLTAEQKDGFARLIESENDQEPPVKDLIESIFQRERFMVLRQNGTVAGRMLMWQLSGGEMDQSVREVLERTLKQVRQRRDDVLKTLKSKAT